MRGKNGQMRDRKGRGEFIRKEQKSAYLCVLNGMKVPESNGSEGRPKRGGDVHACSWERKTMQAEVDR